MATKLVRDLLAFVIAVSLLGACGDLSENGPGLNKLDATTPDEDADREWFDEFLNGPKKDRSQED